MEQWANKEAERILDAFMASEGSDDLLKLQTAIADALRRTYEAGKKKETCSSNSRMSKAPIHAIPLPAPVDTLGFFGSRCGNGYCEPGKRPRNSRWRREEPWSAANKWPRNMSMATATGGVNRARIQTAPVGNPRYVSQALISVNGKINT